MTSYEDGPVCRPMILTYIAYRQGVKLFWNQAPAEKRSGSFFGRRYCVLALAPVVIPEAGFWEPLTAHRVCLKQLTTFVKFSVDKDPVT